MPRQKRTDSATGAATRASSARVRLDGLLVERGMATGRDAAQAMIAGGRITVNGSVVLRPAALVSADADITQSPAPAYVSRGGVKLAGALDAFGLTPDGLVCLDVGASTGGFTDCLLQRGASRVHAVDVGHGQLAWRLRTDPRVIVLERHNARHPLPVTEPIELATADVSFISLRLVLPRIAEALKPGGSILALVKPQFEAGADEVGRGGVVRSPSVRASVVGDVALWAIDHGLRVHGVRESALTGPKGNREYFLLLEKPQYVRVT